MGLVWRALRVCRKHMRARRLGPLLCLPRRHGRVPPRDQQQQAASSRSVTDKHGPGVAWRALRVCRKHMRARRLGPLLCLPRRHGRVPHRDQQQQAASS